MSGGAVVSDGYNVLVAGCLTVSFQRYPESQIKRPAPTPRSHGALPVEMSSSRSGFLPLREAEGLWLGVQPIEQKCCSVEIRWIGAKEGVIPPPWTALVSNFQCVSGLRSATGVLFPFIGFPLSDEFTPCGGIVICVNEPEGIEMRFVSVDEYETRSGKSAPRPILPTDSYAGWLLP